MTSRISFILPGLVCLFLAGPFFFGQDRFNPLKGPYLGQTAVETPEIFLPGKISTGYDEGCSLFYRDALSFLWRTNRAGEFSLFLLEDREGRWQPPKTIKVFNDHSKVWDFTLDPSGDRIYFTSDRQAGTTGSNIWTIQLTGDEWQNPEMLDKSINSDWNDGYPSINRSGEIFFFRRDRENPSDCDIWSASSTADGFTEAARLPDPINTPFLEYDPFISPDGLFLIFVSNREGGVGKGDLYISFRNPGGEWSEPQNLGPEINSSEEDNRPSITTDGKYFFFTSQRIGVTKLPPGVPPARSMPGNGSLDIYWMKADFIGNMNQNR